MPYQLFVIVMNLFWTPKLQDIITNHASICLVVFNSFLRPDFLGIIKESWRYMLLSLSQVIEYDTVSISLLMITVV